MPRVDAGRQGPKIQLIYSSGVATIALRSVLHPVSVSATVVLLVNDHYLKHEYPGWVAGKLSDLAGLIFFPLLLGWLIAVVTRSRRSVPVAVMLTGWWFIAVKTVPLAASISEATISSLVGIPARIVVDPTDLAALPALAVSWWIWRRVSAVEPGRRLIHPYLVVGVAALASMATTLLDVPATVTLVEDGDVYAGVAWDELDIGAGVSVHRSSDGGVTWTPAELATASLRRDAIDTPRVRCDQSNTSRCIAKRPIWEIEFSSDGAITWAESATQTLPAVFTGNPYAEVHSAGCVDGACFREIGVFGSVLQTSSDGGASWAEATSAPPQELERTGGARCMQQESNQCSRRAETGQETYEESHDGGLSWTPIADHDQGNQAWSRVSNQLGIDEQVIDTECLPADDEHCFRIFKPAENRSRDGKLEVTTDGGLHWSSSWSPSLRYGDSDETPRTYALAVDPKTGNLIVAIGVAGVAVRNADGQWATHAVGEANVPLPPAFPPAGPMIIIWGGWAFVCCITAGFWLARTPDRSPMNTPWIPLVAVAAATVSVATVVAASAHYPYGLAVGPGWIRAIASGLVLGVPIIASISLVAWANGFLPVNRIVKVTIWSTLIAGGLSAAIGATHAMNLYG